MLKEMCQQRSTEAWMLLGRVKFGGSHNKLTDLPAAIGQLSMLKLLDVSFNSIVALPDEIGLATSLVKFDCSSNHIKELPSSLGKCSGLSDLKASNNLITSLPEDLMNCSKLTKLDVERNKLTALSENLFASWTMLTELNACNILPLHNFPNIGCLSCLIRLDLRQNSKNFVNPTINNGLLYGVISTVYKTCLDSYLKVLHFDVHLVFVTSNFQEQCTVDVTRGARCSFSCRDIGPSLKPGKMTTLRKLLLSGNPLRTLRSLLVSGPIPALLRYLRSRLSEGEEAKTPAKEEVVTMAARLSLTSKELSLEGTVLSAVPKYGNQVKS
ncbi:hypothetical protein CRYUN_Cryun38cG0051100 [Craigia yunnanensis]